MVKPKFSDAWKSYVFDDLFEFIPNNAFTRAQMTDSGKVKNIHYGEILTKYGAYINANSKDIPYITKEINLSRFSERCYLQSGDVIIADTAEDETVGKALEVINVESPVLAGQHTLLCRPKVRFAERFLGYYLNAACYHDQLLPYIVGTKVSSVSKASIAQTKLVVPEHEEQRCIADVLTAIDELIANQERLIAKKKAIKQGTMQELLTGKKRLPGFSGEWNDYQLGLLGTFLKGSGISRAESNSGNISAVRYGELYTKHQNYIVNYYSHISKEVAADAKQVFCGDILFAGSGETKEEIGKCAAVIDEHIAYAGGDILIFRPTIQLNAIFLGTLLNTSEICKQRAKKGQGDAVVHIHADALSAICIRLPDFDEQNAIAEVFLNMDNEIAILEQKLVKYRQIKQGMMQQLLTGKIRLM